MLAVLACDGSWRSLRLPRITIPEKEQAALLLQLGWTLPEQPPPRITSGPLPKPE